ncbi:MAG: YeeE/YedE thiosulfate transporter family protein, partial [Polyangiaceae bacterium]
GWRASFMAGLLLTGVIWSVVHPASFGAPIAQSVVLTIVAGACVGFGTQLGNGCTSGHGVCGLSRFSLRSLVATLTFMATGALSVFLLRHIFGGGQ